ncbi:MAG: hypothetical protein ACTS6G_00420 [Candidatus Hodgkinia cicadicola]
MFLTNVFTVCINVIVIPSLILILMVREVTIVAFRLFAGWCFVICLCAATCACSFGHTLCKSLMCAFTKELD